MGYRKIHSELASLEVKVAASTAWEVLKNAGIDPTPRTVLPVGPACLRARSPTASAGPAGVSRARLA
jgi:hypothetical protein